MHPDGRRPTADKQWHFKGPARYASIFPAGSVEAVGLANNHSFDYLQAGFNDTVANFRKAHVPVFYQNVPSITTLRGVQTVIIGDCTVVGENTTVIDGAPERVLGEIRRYKRPGNIVVVMMHWGSELDTVPRPWQQAMGRKFIDAGADAVVAAHPHVLQGIERYKGRYIAYSLGNFAFGGNSLARIPDTFILRLRFRVAGGKTRVTGRHHRPVLDHVRPGEERGGRPAKQLSAEAGLRRRRRPNRRLAARTKCEVGVWIEKNRLSAAKAIGLIRYGYISEGAMGHCLRPGPIVAEEAHHEVFR